MSRLPSAPPRARGRRWAVAGALLGLVVALVCWAPAAWLASTVAAATNQHLLLVDARGTVWTGSARVILNPGAGSRDASELPDRLHWALRPGWVDGGFAVRLQLDQDCCIRPGSPITLRLGVASSSLRLPDTPPGQAWIELPASWLSGLGAPWNTIAPEGRIALSAQQFHIDQQKGGRWSLQGAAQLDLRDMSSRLSTLSPLGSYRLELMGAGNMPMLMLRTQQGPLQLSGQGTLGDRVRFKGEATAAPGSEAALANLLNIVGRREGARSIISVG